MIATRYFLPAITAADPRHDKCRAILLTEKHWRKAGIVVGSFLFLISFAGFIRQSSVEIRQSLAWPHLSPPARLHAGKMF